MRAPRQRSREKTEHGKGLPRVVVATALGAATFAVLGAAGLRQAVRRASLDSWLNRQIAGLPAALVEADADVQAPAMVPA